MKTYRLFWENRFADCMTTVFSQKRIVGIVDLKAEITRLREMDREWQPNIILLFDEDRGMLDVNEELKLWSRR